MLVKRLLVVLILLPIGVGFIALGGWAFALLVTAVLGIGAWEYGRIFKHGSYSPSTILMIVSVVVLTIWRQWQGFSFLELLLAASILAAMAWHTVAYERGKDTSAVDFAITLSGLVYLGWLGGYLISLRNLTNGVYWMLLVLPSIAIADSGAFSVGRRIGKHKMAPRVSPKKSWEGYIGGVIFGSLGTMLLAFLWQFKAPEITPLRGLIMGFILAVICPLGDLGESLLKREFGVKDSGNLLPGHGGVLDRIDSWLWAAVIGYYLIVIFWQTQ